MLHVIIRYNTPARIAPSRQNHRHSIDKGLRCTAGAAQAASYNPVSNVELRAVEDLTALRDEELLALVLRRQERALGQLYDRYGRLVYTISLRITGDRQTAEEVVQDVFQNVWQAAGSFQSGIGQFSSWLMGITRHRAIHATRSKRERAGTREQALDAGIPLNDESDIERDVARSILRDTVRAALQELPSNQR